MKSLSRRVSANVAWPPVRSTRLISAMQPSRSGTSPSIALTNTASNEPEANGSFDASACTRSRVGPLTDEPQHLDLEVEHRELSRAARLERSRD